MSLLDPQRQEDGEQVLAEDRQQGQGGLHERIGLWPEVLWGDRWVTDGGGGQVENDEYICFRFGHIIRSSSTGWL